MIKQPIEEIGQKAMLALIERLKHTGTELLPDNINLKLTAELVARESI